MSPFTVLTAVAAPLLQDNINTDLIIPSREIRSVSKTGLADGLFADWRYAAVGGRQANPRFVLNDAAYEGARILLSGANFGCGSSREHAAWALVEYGFKVIVAPSFSPIFLENAVRNGMVPAQLPYEAVRGIARDVMEDPRARRVTVDLRAQTITTVGGDACHFDIDVDAKEMLLSGRDVLDLTLLRTREIDAFRTEDAAVRPWAYL